MRAITYNEATMHNEFLSLDPATGVTTVLNTFDFSTGFWLGDLVPIAGLGTAYAFSEDNKLYTFDYASGAILSAVPLDIAQNMATFMQGVGGKLVGINYNSISGDAEFRSIDPVTGATVLLNTVTLSGNGLASGMVGEPNLGSRMPSRTTTKSTRSTFRRARSFPSRISTRRWKPSRQASCPSPPFGRCSRREVSPGSHGASAAPCRAGNEWHIGRGIFAEILLRLMRRVS